MLDCDPVGECLGFTGDCGDLAIQFSAVPGDYLYGTPPTSHGTLEEYHCEAFPGPNMIDQLLLSVIVGGLALLSALLLVAGFRFSNSYKIAESSVSWLELPGGLDEWNKRNFIKNIAEMVKDCLKELIIDNPLDLLSNLKTVIEKAVDISFRVWIGAEPHKRWHYVPGIGVPYCEIDLVKLWLRFNFESQFSQGFRVAASILSTVSAYIGLQKAGAAVKVKNTVDVFTTTAYNIETIRKQLCSLVGMVVVYLLWAVFAWFTFTCAFALPSVEATSVSASLLTPARSLRRSNANYQRKQS